MAFVCRSLADPRSHALVGIATMARQRAKECNASASCAHLPVSSNRRLGTQGQKAGLANTRGSSFGRIVVRNPLYGARVVSQLTNLSRTKQALG